MKTIVITGGPCSGKTSAMDVLRQRLAAAKIPAVFVDEAGTDLILSGTSPESLGSMLPFQIEVAKLQIQREAAARRKAAAQGGAALIICDRGVADGAAYLPPEEYAQVLDAVGLSDFEAHNRYDAVFCLESTAKMNPDIADSEGGAYTLSNNTARSETPEEAAALDNRTQDAWRCHPQFHFIANAETFDEKVAPLAESIVAIGLKELQLSHNLDARGGAEAADIAHTTDGSPARVASAHVAGTVGATSVHAAGASDSTRAQTTRVEATHTRAEDTTNEGRAQRDALRDTDSSGSSARRTRRLSDPNRPRRAKNSAAKKRPFVVPDGWWKAAPNEAATVGIALVVMALATGFVIGLAVFAAMNLSVWLTELLWQGGGQQERMPWFSLAVCTVGGLVIGLWTHFSRNRVKSLETVMKEFRDTGSFRLESPGKTVVSFLLPLVFGGSVGFEAGLTGLIAAGCCWIRDKLKAAGLRGAHIANVTIAASFSAIFGAPLAGIVAGAESTHDTPDGAHDTPDSTRDATDSTRDATGRTGNPAERADATSVDASHGPLRMSDSGDALNSDQQRSNRESTSSMHDAADSTHVDDYDMRRSAKLVLYMAAAIGAFAGIHAFSLLFGSAAGLPRFDSIQAQGAELLWILPCLVMGYLLTLVFHGSSFAFSRVATQLDSTPFGTIAKPTIAGALLGLAAMAFPLVLFPGEAQSHELMGTWQTWTALALLGTGLLKAAATPLCIRMGWMGGTFFPCIFAGVACGYGLAAITGADPMLLVAITTSSFLAGSTRKPLLSVAILALCFPLTGILWSGLAAVVGGALPVPKAWLDTEEHPHE